MPKVEPKKEAPKPAPAQAAPPPQVHNRMDELQVTGLLQ
jgi:hypothetical protein